MNESTGPRPERRQHARIVAKGTVVAKADDYTHRGRIENLCEGGIFIVSGDAAPEWLLARPIEVQLRLDDGHAEWLASAGRVVRIQPEGFVVQFDAPAAPLLRMIDELMTASRAHLRVMSVILVDANDQRRFVMVAGFRAAGCDVVEAATPLSAIVRLGEASFEPDIIAVADSSGSAAEEMRRFIERDHPDAKLVTIGDELFEPEGKAHWLSSANPNADLASRVRQLLFRAR